MNHITKEMFEDFNFKQMVVSEGNYRLWCVFSPYYEKSIYKIEFLKTHEIVIWAASFETAIEEFNKLV